MRGIAVLLVFSFACGDSAEPDSSTGDSTVPMDTSVADSATMDTMTAVDARDDLSEPREGPVLRQWAAYCNANVMGPELQQCLALADCYLDDITIEAFETYVDCRERGGSDDDCAVETWTMTMPNGLGMSLENDCRIKHMTCGGMWDGTELGCAGPMPDSLTVGFFSALRQIRQMAVRRCFEMPCGEVDACIANVGLFDC